MSVRGYISDIIVKRGSTWVCNFPHKARFHANLCV